MTTQPDDEEQGICLDNDSPTLRMMESDEGIPIRGFTGQPEVLDHSAQSVIRVDRNYNCPHAACSLHVVLEGSGYGEMTYKCMSCGIVIIQGMVSGFTYELKKKDPVQMIMPDGTIKYA